MTLQRTFGTATLVAGPELLFSDRAVRDVIDAALAEQPDASVVTLTAGALTRGSLTEATGGSLLAAASVVVVDELADLPADLADEVVDLVMHPFPEVALILIHHGGLKGKAVLDRLRKANVRLVDCASVKHWELPQFVIGEVRRRHAQIDPATAALLVDAVGSDLRSLAGGIKQLLDDATDGLITEATVRRYFGGRAEVTSFAVADDALAGNSEGALGKLRWAVSTGVAPVLVTSALASALRNLGKFLDARDARVRDADLARTIGVPPWKLKDLNRQARDWNARGVAAALQSVAVADAQIKGAASDPGFALEQVVLTIIARRGRGR
ncbi:MAG: DNA polymerase III subunit delta [Micropruina sp.]